MRATLRITGLLVLSSLFSSICSDGSSNVTELSTPSESAVVLSKAPGSTEAPLNTTVPATTQKPTDTAVTATSIKAAVVTAVRTALDLLTATPGNASFPSPVTSGLPTIRAASTQSPPTSHSVQTTSQQENMTTRPSENVTAELAGGFDTNTTTMITTTLRPEYSNRSGENYTEGSRAPATTTALTAPPSEASPPPVIPPSTATTSTTTTTTTSTTSTTTTSTTSTTSLAKTEPAKTQASHTRPSTKPLPSVGPSTTAPPPYMFIFPPPSGQPETKEQKVLGEVCKRLFPDWRSGTCRFKWRQQNGSILFDSIDISVNSSLAASHYEEITKPRDNKTLIAILASCGSLLIMIIILAVCASHHRRPYSENQQHLTEELQTVENGYHDNPTLEVMEVQPEMQEKKVALNGEFNDSWIVPIDNLLKEDIADEEDTHL